MSGKLNMNLKKLICLGMSLSGLMVVSVAAQASSVYKTGGIFDQKYPGNTSSCFVCHNALVSVFTAYGTQFKAVGGVGGGASTVTQLTLIDGQDADSDGFTNGQEVNGKADVNLNTSTPFTVAAAGATASDSALTNVFVRGDAAATEQAFADPYSLAAASEEIIGNVSLTINTSGVTIFAKAAGIDSTARMYAVDAQGQGTLSPTTAWTANSDGSITVNAIATNPATAVLVRTIPTVINNVTIPGSINYIGDNDGEGDDGTTTKGCLVPGSSPLMIFFALLTLGYLGRRKKS